MDRNKKPSHSETPQLLHSSRDFFSEMVQNALRHRKIETLPQVTGYLVDLLEHYVLTERLFDEEDDSGRKRHETLAEMFLKAAQAEPAARLEILKKLGDTSLYVSGFFGDSLQRKLVDVDYYAEMGGTAYRSLADSTRDEQFAKMYREFAYRFLEFVDALTYISQQTQMQNRSDLLRLFELYSKTGSQSARESLESQGVISLSPEMLRHLRSGKQ